MTGDDALIRLIIVGIGGHGRETLDIVEARNEQATPQFEFIGFLDDGPGDPEVMARRGLRVIGEVGDLRLFQACYVIAIGSPAERTMLDERARSSGCEAATLVHPSAVIGSDVEFAPGVIVAAGAHITTNVRIGRHSHVNVGATIAHDCRVGDYVSLSPGVHLSGNVTVGDGVFLGTGAVVTPGCELGAGAKVGAGAVVIGDVGPGQTVVGVPARPAGP